MDLYIYIFNLNFVFCLIEISYYFPYKPNTDYVETKQSVLWRELKNWACTPKKKKKIVSSIL